METTSKSMQLFYSKDNLEYVICKDSDGYAVKLPMGNVHHYGTGYTLDAVKALHGLQGIDAHEIIYSDLACGNFNEKMAHADGDWTTLGRLSVYDGLRVAKLDFTIPQDKTRVYLHVKNITKITVTSLNTSNSDVYGKRQWTVNRDTGQYNVGTYFNKGSYSLSISGRSSRSGFSYDLEVRAQL